MFMYFYIEKLTSSHKMTVPLVVLFMVTGQSIHIRIDEEQLDKTKYLCGQFCPQMGIIYHVYIHRPHECPQDMAQWKPNCSK